MYINNRHAGLFSGEISIYLFCHGDKNKCLNNVRTTFVFTENLSRRSATIISVSSIFESYTTSNANDGNLNTTYIFCSHTDLNQTTAWLQVDLGKPYSINHVKIYYRKDGMHILFSLIIHF